MRTLQDITQLDQTPGNSLYIGHDLVLAYRSTIKTHPEFGQEPAPYVTTAGLPGSVWNGNCRLRGLLSYPGQARPVASGRSWGWRKEGGRGRIAGPPIADTTFGIVSGLRGLEADLVAWTYPNGGQHSTYTVKRIQVNKARRCLEWAKAELPESNRYPFWAFPWHGYLPLHPGRPPKKHQGDWQRHCPRIFARMLTSELLPEMLTGTAVGWIERESVWLAKMPQGYAPLLTACSPNVPYHQNPPKYWGRVGNPLVTLRELWTYGWQWLLPDVVRFHQAEFLGFEFTPEAWERDLGRLMAGPESQMPLDPDFDKLRDLGHYHRVVFSAVYAAAAVVLWHSIAVKFARNQGLGACLGGLVLPALPDWIEEPLNELECPPHLRQILFAAEARTVEKGTATA